MCLISNFCNIVISCMVISSTQVHLVFGMSYASSAKETMCPQCFHMNISLENVSPGAEEVAHSVLAKVFDPACVKGEVRPTACKNSSTQNIMCGTIIFHARSTGLQDIYPAAVMEEMNVIRDCIVVNSTTEDDEDGCVDIQSLSDSALQALTSRFANHRKSWNTTEFTDGRICLHDGTRNITERQNTELTDNSNNDFSLIYDFHHSIRICTFLLTVTFYFIHFFV